MSLLEIDSLTVSFAGLRALSQVSFAVPAGSIFGLIGPNGAGKTTLLNCLSRIYTPTSGAMRFAGEDLLSLPIHGVAGRGICRTFQNLELFQQASVRDNVLIGNMLHHRSNLVAELFNLPASRRCARAAGTEVDALLTELGLRDCAEEPVTALSYGVQKMVELARALAARPRLLLLDEPAAGMNPEESRQLGKIIRRVRDERKVTVLLIEHDMALVMGVCDSIVALDHGELVCQGPPDVVRRDPQVIKAYLGAEPVDA